MRRSLGTKTANKKKITFQPKQDMVGGSKKASARNKRSQVFTSSNNKRSLSTISRPTRNNRRPAKAPKRKMVSTYESDNTEMEMDEEPHNQTMKPVAQRTRSQKEHNYNYKRYLARVLRLHNANSKEQNLTISSKAMECMSNFMCDIFHKITAEAGQQVKKDKRKTLGDWDLKSAVKILMPGELGKHANARGYTKLQNMKHAVKLENTQPHKTTYIDPKTGCICPMPIKH